MTETPSENRTGSERRDYSTVLAGRLIASRQSLSSQRKNRSGRTQSVVSSISSNPVLLCAVIIVGEPIHGVVPLLNYSSIKDCLVAVLACSPMQAVNEV